MQDGSYNLRKIIIWVLIAIFIFFGLIWLYGYLTKGKIVIKTDNQENNVKIEKVDTSENKKRFVEQHQGDFSVAVKPGTYTVSVFGSNGTYGVNKTVAVKARQTVKVELNPPGTVNAEPVYGQEVDGVFANSKELLFLDASANTIKRIDSNNNVSSFLPLDIQFKDVQWSDSGSGVAQTFNSTLYKVNEQSVTPIKLPFDADSKKLVDFSLSPDGQLYVSNGGDIYSKKLGMKQNFKKIYSTGGSAARLFAGPDKLAVIGLGMREGANSLLAIDSQGQVSKKPVNATQAAWSPDGKYLVANSVGNYIVFSSNLHKIKAFTAPSSSSLAWKDNKVFFYNINDQLWQYSVSSGEAKKLSALGASNNIDGIFPSQDGSYLYFSADAGQKSLLLRISLEGQSFNNALISLRAVLPKTVGVCTLDYINFTKPVVTVTFPASGTLPKNCLRAARAEIRQYDINPDILDFKAVPRQVRY